MHPVGVEKDQAGGVDQATSRALAATLRRHGAKRVVITSAQNATPVNREFLATLLGYCRHRKALLVVIPYRYKNPTSMWSAKAEHDDWWAKELHPYLMDRRVELNPNLVLLGDIKTQPTATSPLQGFETVTGHRSAIVGHPKLALKTVPTPQSKMAKILTTTGSVTVKNYIPSKAGKKAEHHHTFGACVVELSGKKFHLRQLNATRDGSFCDLDREYSGSRVAEKRIEALVMGDFHDEFADEKVVEATFGGKNSIVGALRPKTIVYHDWIDFYARSHHHRGDPFIAFAKHHAGRGNVERDLDAAFARVDRQTPPGTVNVFVPSNHPDALARWVKEKTWVEDPENCVFGAQTFVAMCRGSTWGKSGARTIDPIAYWAKQKLKTANQAVFPARNESYRVKDIEVAYHGDIGANGARGSRADMSRIGVKTIIGHSHSPGITDGCYQVGTSSRLDLEYQKGASSWLHAHCVVYSSGKRSLIIVVDGEWRA